MHHKTLAVCTTRLYDSYLQRSQSCLWIVSSLPSFFVVAISLFITVPATIRGGRACIPIFYLVTYPWCITVQVGVCAQLYCFIISPTLVLVYYVYHEHCALISFVSLDSKWKCPLLFVSFSHDLLLLVLSIHWCISLSSCYWSFWILRNEQFWCIFLYFLVFL